MFIKYRLQWPAYIDDCYECGKGIHFQSPLRRVYRPEQLSNATAFIIEQARNIMRYDSPIFSKESMVMIEPKEFSATIVIPDVGNFGFNDTLWIPTKDDTNEYL